MNRRKKRSREQSKKEGVKNEKGNGDNYREKDAN